jgi:hypothetical protein
MPYAAVNSPLYLYIFIYYNRAFRPDKFQLVVNKLIDFVLGENFMEERPVDMNHVT